MENYKLVSGDSHILEPPDLWAKRLPRQLRDRAPRMQRFPQGDAWVFEGLDSPLNFGMNAVAGKPPEQVGPWMKWEDTPPGGHDPAARLKEQDADGVEVEVLYPSPRVTAAVCHTAPRDAAFHLELVRAYNDWLSEFCAYDPQRLVGVPLMPNCGVEEAVTELHRTARLPGLKSMHMGLYPDGTTSMSPSHDPLWAAAEEIGTPIGIHVSLSAGPPRQVHYPGFKVPGTTRWDDAPGRIMEMVFSGMFERFPRLTAVLAEIDCGWIPYFKEQLDLQYQRKRFFHGLNIQGLPSSTMDRHLAYTFIVDRYGIQMRHAVGLNGMMWSSDYPHVILQWPRSWDSVEERMAGVPADEKYQILAGNARRIYRLPAPIPPDPQS